MTVFIEYDSDRDRYDLMVTGNGMGPIPAGPRIFRAPPHPDVTFTHDTMAEAKIAQDKIEKYFAGLGKKQPTKKELREVEAWGHRPSATTFSSRRSSS